MSIETSAIYYRLLPPYKYTLSRPAIFKTDICPEEDINHDFFSLKKDGMLFVNAGYSWDGSSGPALDTENFMRPSLAHDTVFQCNQLFPDKMPKDWRVKANKLLVRLAKEDGMSWIRRKWVYWAVDHFGKGDPKDINKYKQELVSPK